MTYGGPASLISASSFISSTVPRSGGAVYHNSNDESDALTTSDCLFTNNQALYVNGSDDYTPRGGGAFEDFRGVPYTSKYSFSFFSRNSAPKGVGNDISIHDNKLDINNIQHCFTTNPTNSLWNTKYQGYEKWLPQGSIYFVNSTTEGATETIDKNYFTCMHTPGSYL